MKNYTVRTDREVAGHWRIAGIPFPLSDTQAVELTLPFGDVVQLAETEKDVPDAKLNGNKRTDGKTA